MNYVEEYKKHIERSRTQNPIGYIEYKVRPSTDNAKRAFAEKIENVVEERPLSLVRRILSAFDFEKLTKKLTEENFSKANFDKRFELHHWEGTNSEIAIIKETILRNTAASLFLVKESEIELMLGEFVRYPVVKEPTFDDIPDLRTQRKEVKK